MILSLLRERESLWDILRRETRPIYLYGMGDGAQKALTLPPSLGSPLQGCLPVMAMCGARASLDSQ